MKKLAMLFIGILLSINISAKTTIKPFVEIESNKYTNSTKEDEEKIDKLILGLELKQSLTEKAYLDMEFATYDYDYFGDKDNAGNMEKSKSRNRITAYLYNELPSYKKIKINLGLGFRKDEDTINNEKMISYRVRPKVTAKLAKHFKYEGDWMFAKEKTDEEDEIGGYSYYHEISNGIKYTGFDKYSIIAQLYSEYNKSIEKNDDSSEHEMQMRIDLKTKVAGFSLEPWVRIGLGEIKYKDINGKDISDSVGGLTRNRYGINIGKKIQEVKYETELYIQTENYSKNEVDDEMQTCCKFSAEYKF